MPIQNQGLRKDLNLAEIPIDAQALNNLAGEGIAGDLRILSNNLRNTSSIAYNSNLNGFFTFPESQQAVFTNNDVVSVGTTVSFASTTLQPSVEYFICNSDGESQFKISLTPSTSDVGLSTITISGTPSPAAFNIIRKNPVHKENLINFIEPEVQDALDEFSWIDNLNASFDESGSNIDSARYFIEKKYQNGRDLSNDRDIKYEGSVTISDPANLNANKVGLDDPKSPGVFIGDTRAFSSNDQPWTETGTSIETSSETVSIGELTFNGDVKIEGLNVENQSSNVGIKSYTHKLPVVIDGTTYFILLTE